MLNVHRNHKVYQGREEEGEEGMAEVGPGRLIIYLSPLRCHCGHSFLFQKLWSLDTVSFVTLSLTINGTLKWLSLLPILKQESFWWLQSVAIGV